MLHTNNSFGNSLVFGLRPMLQNKILLLDVWLQAKQFLREFYHLCDSFPLVKLLFELVTHGQTFNSSKLFEYAVFPRLT